MRKILIIVFLIFTSLSFSYVELSNGWEYRWESEKTWHRYETPGVPLENKNEMLYLRYKLPDVKLENPAIYLTGIFDNSSIKVGETEIYNTFAKSFFSPKSIFRIPSNFQNKYLIIKVISKRRDVGFFGEFLLGNELDLLKHQIFVELDKILLVIFSLFVLIISIILYIYFFLLQRDLKVRRSIIFLGIFSFGIGLFVSGQTQTFKYFYENNKFWSYVMDIGKYISPIGIMGFFYNVFDYSTKKVIKWLVFFHEIYFFSITAIQLIRGFEYNYYVAYVLPFYFLMLLDIIIMIHNLVIGYHLKDSKAYIFSASIILVSAFSIYEILGDFRLIKWERPIIQWSIFILINSMIILIIKNIKELNLELSVKSRILENWNKDLEREVAKRTKDIKILLDNSEEGFLSFNRDYTIGKEYSNECRQIFGRNIEGLNFLNLIFHENEKEKNFIKRIFDDFFSEENKFKKDVYLTFLPSEIKINEKYFKVHFKYVEHEDVVMVKLKDTTMEKRLKEKVTLEKEKLKKIVIIVKNYEAFVMNIKGFRKLLDEIINSKKAIKNYYMEFHSYKGIFAQFYLSGLAEKLHEIEEKVLGNKVTIDDVEKVRKTFEEEIQILQEELGYEIGEDILKIPRVKILELEDKLKKFLNEDNEIIREIRKLRFKPFEELIKPYMPYVKDISRRLGKSINEPKLYSKDEILVDPEKYYDLTKSFINIFKNIVDHGIEIPEIRIENGKEANGNIIIELFKKGKEINVIIKDDGAGVDIKELKEIAKIKGVSFNNTQELLGMVFLEDVSVKDEVTEFSGRGIGLSSVKREVEKLNGKITIESEYGKGTTLKIIIPEVI